MNPSCTSEYSPDHSLGNVGDLLGWLAIQLHVRTGEMVEVTNSAARLTRKRKATVYIIVAQKPLIPQG